MSIFIAESRPTEKGEINLHVIGSDREVENFRELVSLACRSSMELYDESEAWLWSLAALRKQVNTPTNERLLAEQHKPVLLNIFGRHLPVWMHMWRVYVKTHYLEGKISARQGLNAIAITHDLIQECMPKAWLSPDGWAVRPDRTYQTQSLAQADLPESTLQYANEIGANAVASQFELAWIKGQPHLQSEQVRLRLGLIEHIEGTTVFTPLTTALNPLSS